MRPSRHQRDVGFVLLKFLGIRRAIGVRRRFGAGCAREYRRRRKQPHRYNRIVADSGSRRSNQREKECAVQDKREEKSRQSCPQRSLFRRRLSLGRRGMPQSAERRFIVAMHVGSAQAWICGNARVALSPDCTPRRRCELLKLGRHARFQRRRGISVRSRLQVIARQRRQFRTDPATPERFTSSRISVPRRFRATACGRHRPAR